MNTSTSPSSRSELHASLCPVCGASKLRILTSIEVEVHVVVDDPADEMVVLDELHGDAMWDEDTVALCPSCHWQGTVGDVGNRRLTALASP